MKNKIINKKNKPKNLILVHFLFPVVLSWLIITFAKAQDGLEILKQAEAYMGSVAFSAECNWQGGIKTTVIQKKWQNGNFLIKKKSSSMFKVLYKQMITC